MKKGTRWSWLGLAILMTGGCVGDAEIVEPPAPRVTNVTITPASSSLQVGQTTQLTATATNAQGQAVSIASFNWQSSSSTVASVSSTGTVTAAGPGTATITASVSGVTGSASVTVTVPVASVTIAPASGTVTPGGTIQLTATTRDAGGNILSGRSISWSSSNGQIASVSSSGLVTGVASGTATITATSEGVQGTASITVLGNLAIRVENQLVGPINVTINGVLVGQVAAAQVQTNGTVTPTTQTFETARVNQVALSWALVQPTLSGRSLGDAMTGSFSPVQVTNQTTGINYTIDSVVGETSYFAPLVTNQTAVRLLMGVNMGLTAENRCECVILAGGQRVYFGYYRLFTNTNVRAYNDGTNYTGNFVFWAIANNNLVVQAGSGIALLLANMAPSPDIGNVSGAIEPVVSSASRGPRSVNELQDRPGR